jgi:hypothetical protein
MVAVWTLAAAIRHSRQLLLRIPNRFEQVYRVECREPLAQLCFDRLLNHPSVAVARQ